MNANFRLRLVWEDGVINVKEYFATLRISGRGDGKYKVAMAALIVRAAVSTYQEKPRSWYAMMPTE